MRCSGLTSSRVKPLLWTKLCHNSMGSWNPQCDGICRWGLLEVNRPKTRPWGWGPRDRISGFIRRGRKRDQVLHHVRTLQESRCVQARKGPSPRVQAGTLTLDVTACKLWGESICCVSHWVCGSLLEQPEHTNTTSFFYNTFSLKILKMTRNNGYWYEILCEIL